MTTQHQVLLFTTVDAHHFGISPSELTGAMNIVKLRPLKAPAMLDFMLYAEWEDILYLYEGQEGKHLFWF